MRKLYILLILTFGSLVAMAQPTITIGNGDGCTGDQICLPITTVDFTNINSLRFSLAYDPTVLSNPSVQNFNPDMQALGNLGPALFSFPTTGVISFDTWETGDCSDPGNTGVTLADDAVLFELCFDAIGTYGSQSAIEITSSPTQIRCTRNATECLNIGVIRENGEVTLCVREFVIEATDVSGNEGDQVCVDFNVTGFDELSGTQFTVNYDPTILEFHNLIPNTDLPNNTLGTYGVPPDLPEGTITVSWSFLVPGQPQPSLPDGENMFTACFNILDGACEMNSPITFGGDPTPIEAFNEDPDNPSEVQAVPFSLEAGSVQVNDCDPTGLQIVIDCGAPANINDEVCVEFSAGANFTAVRDMQYIMQWNPDILEYSSFSDPNNLSQLTEGGDIDASNADNGILALDWDVSGPAQSLANGELIYEVCFNVVGLGGDSPIQIITPGSATVQGVDIGINPTNCTVEVIQPESVGINVGDLEVPLGGQGCLPITVTNFTDVTNLEFTLFWDETMWQFGSVQNQHPALGGTEVITPIGGTPALLTYDWENAAGVTLNNDDILFELCLETAPTATPGDCDVLQTGGFPIAERAETLNSNGEDIGLVVNTGDICVLFPEGFGLTAVSVNGGWQETLCVDFTVESFDNILQADFFVQYDPTVLSYNSSTALAWTDLQLMPSMPDIGTITASFTSPTAVAIPDGEVAFEVCFDLIGFPEECSVVSLVDNPAQPVQTTNGEGSIVFTDGEVCIEERIVIESIDITPVSCPGACDGQVVITVAEWPGQGFIGTTWDTDPMQFTPLMLENVCEGELPFTIFDVLSGVSLTDTILIESTGLVPTAEILGDEVRMLACDPPQILLSAVDDPALDYLWFFNTVSGMGDGNTSTKFASAPGDYIVQVTHQVSGCTATDTVTVLPAELPTVDAGADPVPGITCTNECVTLNGLGAGQNLAYHWELVSGNPENIDSSTINTQSLTVCGPGTYRLIARNTVTGCEASDDVVVTDDRIQPSACVNGAFEDGQSLEQNCDGTNVVFDASCSNGGPVVVDFAWYDDADFSNQIGTAATQGYNELGTYALIVTEQTSGCVDTTYVEVIPNSTAPVVTLDEAGAISCLVDSIQLNANVTPFSNDLVIQWFVTDGASISQNGMENSLTPTALTPGTYELLVTDPNTACQGGDLVVIADQTELPLAVISNAAEDLFVNCTTSSIILDGTTSASGDTITYQWFVLDQESMILGTADTLEVTGAADYVLQVINETSGCTTRDTVTVGENLQMPTVVLDQLTDIINCQDQTVSVTATVEGVDDFTFQAWTVTGGGNILSASADSMMITVDAAGVYNISVINELSTCVGVADFVVTEDTTPPVATVNADTMYINCAAGFVTLSGAGSSTGMNIDYNWMNQTGDQPTVTDAIQTDVTEAGTYLFTVTNNDNFCTKDTTILVLMDTIAPVGSIAAVDDLTCMDMSRELTITVTEADNYTVTWTPDGQTMPTTGDVVTVTSVGTYTANIVNTDNGCEASTEITVGGDLTPPTIELAALPAFDCLDETHTIDATASSADVTAEWTTVGVGGVITEDPTNELLATVDNVGTYMLVLTSVTNGCPAETTFTVDQVANLTLPTVTIEDPAFLDCVGTAVVIDASATNANMDVASTTWTADAGQSFTNINDFSISTIEAGTYTLAIVQNGALACEAEGSVTVEDDPNTPVADAGDDVTLLCDGLEVQLDASASTPPSATIVYAWTGDVSGDVTGPMPSVANPGEFQLTVTNTENGCSATSEVVTATLQLPTIVANAGDDFIACDTIADLNAAAISDPLVTGVWTTTSTATIDMPDNSVTMVDGLVPGQATFVWTLSAVGCPDFSSDEVVITLANPVTANNDELVITAEEHDNVAPFSIVANDQLGTGAQFELTVLTPPAFGSYDTTAIQSGSLELTLGLLDYGVTEMTYEICSTLCPSLCDTASVTITAEIGDNPFVPNTITPNGDGANEAFIFDKLLFDPNPEVNFPDNHLIIFNRWGDIIFEAKPYNNDWTGLGEDNKPVAEGTYYYELRLNIGKGEIIKGDITVIR